MRYKCNKVYVLIQTNLRFKLADKCKRYSYIWRLYRIVKKQSNKEYEQKYLKMSKSPNRLYVCVAIKFLRTSHTHTQKIKVVDMPFHVTAKSDVLYAVTYYMH